MTAAIGKYAAKKLLGKQMDKHKDKAPAGLTDPYFEYITLPNGKKKKVKRQIPDFIPEHDAHVLARAKSRAYHLDMSLFNFMGIRFGWESAIGLIPEVGDVIGLFMALSVYKTCCKVDGGLPSGMKTQMLLFIVADFVVGLVPFLGDLLDAYIKCNTRNVWILEQHLRKKYGPRDPVLRQSAGLEMFEDEHDRDTLAQLKAMGIQEEVADKADRERRHPSPPHAPAPAHTHSAARDGARWDAPSRTDTRRAEPPRTKEEAKPSRGWFGGGGSKKQQQQSDLEARRQDPRRERRG